MHLTEKVLDIMICPKLRDKYKYSIPSDTKGECWAISAHPNGQSVVTSGDFNGKSLSDFGTLTVKYRAIRHR